MSDTLKETIVLDSADDVIENEVELGENSGAMSITANIDDADNSPVTEEQPFELPEKLQGKSDKEIAQMYLELEKKLGEGKPAEEEPVVETEDETAEAEETEGDEDDNGFEGEIDESKSADSVAGFQSLWAEQGGKLSDAQWTTVQDLTGMSDADLKQWEAYSIAQINQQGATHDDTVIKEAGGNDKYNEMIDWASENFSDEEVDTLNTYLDDPKFYKKGLQLLKSQYNLNNGNEPAVTVGEIPSDAATYDGYDSEEEVFKAQQDPRYGTDPAYDKAFDRKLLSFMKRTNQLPR